MPFLLNNPGHWHLRAQEARLLASKLEDPEAEATILKIAEDYERLAVRSAKRLAEQKQAQPDNRSPTQARNPVPGSVLIPNLLS
jgi:hypothetical protein